MISRVDSEPPETSAIALGIDMFSLLCLLACSQASRLGQLAGHKSRVSTISFSSDETRAVTSSKDGTARVWKLDVRWDVGEDPRTLVEIPTGLSEGYDLAVYIQMEKEYQCKQASCRRMCSRNIH